MAYKRLPIVEAEGPRCFPTAFLGIAGLQPLGKPVRVLEARIARQRLNRAALERVVADGQLGRHGALFVVVADAEPPVTTRHRVDCRLPDRQGNRQCLALPRVFTGEVELLSTTGEHERHLVRPTMLERGGEHHRSLKLKVQVARGVAKRPRVGGCAEIETDPPGRVSQLRNDRRPVCIELPLRQRRYHATEQAPVVIRPAAWV